MAYGRESLNLTLSLWKDGLFNNFESVIELGSQTLSVPIQELGLVFNKVLGMPARPQQRFTAEEFYKALGFKRYHCIDTNGENGAFVFDLNKDIVAEHEFQEKFNLVTNHGTAEHCFDQYNVFRNIHNLCAPGGVMVHGLPFQGYLNHGFYNYQPAFYRALASANNYRMIGLYLNINADAGDISTYSESLMKHLSLPPGSTMLLLAVMQKLGSDPFRTPFDGKYVSSIALENNSYEFVKTPSSLFLPDQFDIINSLPSKQMAKLLKERGIAKLKRICKSLGFWPR